MTSNFMSVTKKAQIYNTTKNNNQNFQKNGTYEKELVIMSNLTVLSYFLSISDWVYLIFV